MARNDESLLASPCGINGDVSRDTPALAFGVNYSVFKEPLSDHAAQPVGGSPSGRSASAEPTLTSRLGRRDTQVSEDLWAGPARGVRVNASGARHQGRTKDCMGRMPNLQPTRPNFATHRASIAPDGIQWHET